MTTTLRIATDLALPLDAVTQSIAVLAKRRAGKSYLARRFVEQVHKAAVQVVILDPKGDWWGARFAKDGRGPGMPILIIGGERGDIPLEPGSGEVVARLCVEERVSVLLDLSLLRKHEVATFCAAFLETLYRLKARELYRTPLALVIDEADAIAPQKPQPNEARMLGAVEDIVRRGGQRGLSCMLITQRSAVLSKNVLTQAQIMIALRTIAPQDLAAMNAWIDVHGEPEQRRTLMQSLPSLPIGEAWVWSPGWPTAEGIFQRIKVAPIETFDSGATPKPGERRVEPKGPAEVDLEAVRRQMAETIERVKADDPKALRARIAELEREVRAKPAAAAPVVVPKEVPAISPADRKAFERNVAELDALADKADRLGAGLVEVATAMQERAQGARKIAADLRAALAGPPVVAVRPAPPSTPRPALSAKRPASASNGHAVDLPKGELAVLTAAAQCGDEGATREQLSILTGYKRSTRDAYVQRARERGFLGEVRGNIVATPEGLAALGPSFESLPTGDALRVHWLARLPQGEAQVLEVLCAQHPKAVHRDIVTDLTGYKRSTRDAYLQRLATRKLITVERDGVTARGELFG